jgi:hypothetical protein
MRPSNERQGELPKKATKGPTSLGGLGIAIKSPAGRDFVGIENPQPPRLEAQFFPKEKENKRRDPNEVRAKKLAWVWQLGQ